METPKIYVACLSSYNAGILYGAWIDVEDLEQVNEEIKVMLSLSKEAPAEEFAIHDYENFQGIDIQEYTPISEVVEIAQALSEHGEAYAAAYYLESDHEAALSLVSDNYYGYYGSEDDFAQEYFESTGDLSGVPDIIKNNIDWDSVAKELMYDFSSHNGHYFFNC